MFSFGIFVLGCTNYAMRSYQSTDAKLEGIKVCNVGLPHAECIARLHVLSSRRSYPLNSSPLLWPTQLPPSSPPLPPHFKTPCTLCL